jgi:multiple sugar transport system permease protein
VGVACIDGNVVTTFPPERAVVRKGVDNLRKIAPGSISRMRRREAIAFYITISPWILGFLMFILGPIVVSIYLSFTDYSVIRATTFIGFENFKNLGESDLFWQSLKVTAIYTFAAVPLHLTISLFVALLLNMKIPALALFRTIYYMPTIITGVAVALLWSWIFNPQFGVINDLLSKVGIIGPMWLGDESWALPALVVMSCWGTGSSMLIFLASLQAIPTQLYEAAEIDGAKWWTKFWRVTLPLITPVVLFNLVIGVINSFQSFTNAYIMTNGGPNNATLFYVLNLYRQAFQFFHMGYASALAWILFVIIMVCTLLIFRTSAAWVYYEAEVKG